MTPLLDAAGHALERDVAASERHARGQYFTPEPLIRFVFDRLDELGIGPKPGAVVLDPACGSGRFLAAADRRWPGRTLKGYETDPAALAIAAEVAEVSAESFLDANGRSDVDVIVGNPPYLRDRGAKRDLYVAFVEQAFEHLRPGGTLALVLSNAWLDVEYGAAVRTVLRKRAAIHWLVESSGERWFPGAKVHTMVLIAQRGADDDTPVRFGTCEERLPAAPTLRRTVRQGDLPDGPWGSLLRASAAFLTVRDGPQTVALGDLCDVRRGFTTNNNGYFYPRHSALQDIERTALAPVFRSPKRVKAVRAVARELPDRVFLGGVNDGPGAAAWVQQHHDGEPPALTSRVASRQFLLKGYAGRFRQPLFDRAVLCDQQLYAVTPKKPVDPLALAGVLNSTWMHLSLEYAGRVNFGDGVLWLGLRDARARLRIPSPVGADAVAAAFQQLPTGPVPPISTLYSDRSWGPAMSALDAAVALLLQLDAATMHALQVELVARTATRTGGRPGVGGR
jgi:SAM-dependent methyltransferase